MTKWADQIVIPLYQYHDRRALLENSRFNIGDSATVAKGPG